jgi:hypothetical protein
MQIRTPAVRRPTAANAAYLPSLLRVHAQRRTGDPPERDLAKIVRRSRNRRRTPERSLRIPALRHTAHIPLTFTPS